LFNITHAITKDNIPFAFVSEIGFAVSCSGSSQVPSSLTINLPCSEFVTSLKMPAVVNGADYMVHFTQRPGASWILMVIVTFVSIAGAVVSFFKPEIFISDIVLKNNLDDDIEVLQKSFHEALSVEA